MGSRSSMWGAVGLGCVEISAVDGLHVELVLNGDGALLSGPSFIPVLSDREGRFAAPDEVAVKSMLCAESPRRKGAVPPSDSIAHRISS
jgi:hypothetical protein